MINGSLAWIVGAATLHPVPIGWLRLGRDMRYRLRTLMILLALGPPMLAGTWLTGTAIAARFAARNRPRIVRGLFAPMGPGLIEIRRDELPPSQAEKGD